MRKQIMSELLKHVRKSHPDLLLQFDDEGALMRWLEAKLDEVTPTIQAMKKKCRPEPQILEACMTELVASLGVSRFDYICHILEEEFEADHSRLLQAVVFRTEALNMVSYCRSTFDDLRFSAENEDNRFTRYAIVGMIREYLDNQRGEETVSDGIQQQAEAAGQY